MTLALIAASLAVLAMMDYRIVSSAKRAVVRVRNKSRR